MRDDEKMTVKPEFEADYEKYVNNNQDGYGNACVVAGAAVGAALDEGKSPQEAHDTMYGQGLTGFMAGCVAQAVSHFHPKGEEFRKWWNAKHNVSEDEKGVVNPAILVLKD